MKSIKALFSPRETLMLTGLGTFIVGLLIALQLRFPVKYESISKAAGQCEQNKVFSFKINLLGDVREIACADGTVVKVYYPR